MIKTTIVGFGDSLTYGYGVKSSICFINRLDKYMPEYFPFISWNIINSGINGDTTKSALKRVEKDVLRHNPNIVLILFGTNDSSNYNGQKITPNMYKDNLSEIIKKIKSHNNRTGLNFCIPIPIIITPPPVYDKIASDFTTNEKIIKYKDAAKETAKKYNCPIVDFYDYLIEESNGIYIDYLQQDGIHLSEKGYDCLYDCIFSGISRLIDYEGILKDYDIKV